MAATPDKIPTDLTIEIGDAPSPDRFLKIAAAFFGYVTEISKLVASGGQIPRWVVKVREGSDLVALEPETEAPTPAHFGVYERAAVSVYTLLEKGLDAAALPEPALKHLTTLSELASGPRQHPTNIRLWFQRKPVAVDSKIVAMVREEERLGYSDFGTIEGTMDTLKDQDGRLQFRVKDPVFGYAVMCHIDEAQLEEAFRVFRKRVEVSGVIRYRKDGTPLHIKVEKIEPLPSDDELPGPDEVRSILRRA